MCNAWNHPPDCTCGFGGDGHLGGRSAVSYAPRYGGESERVPVSKPVYESYVNPNAQCPICADSVFFYRSPDGGRVYFDELGPPWPKHPCTDRRILVNTMNLAYRDEARIKAPIVYAWQKEGWSPLYVRSVRNIDQFVRKIIGIWVDQSITIYTTKEVTLKSGNYTVAHLRVDDSEKYDISYLDGLGNPISKKAYMLHLNALSALRISRTKKQENRNTVTLVGTVKWFDVVKGYGFITPDDGSRDVIVHARDLKRSKILSIYEGERVQATTKASRRGIRVHYLKKR